MTTNAQPHKVGLMGLTALTVGAMVGGGVWSLPQTIASGASVAAAMVGWSITAVGMLCLTFLFRFLQLMYPKLNNGIYSYAYEGFGAYASFNSAWGYWISGMVGNVSYAVLLFSALNYFFPWFGEGNSIYAIVGESLLIWVFYALIMQGVKVAVMINLISTICRLVPLALFLVFIILAFKASTFTFDFYGKSIGTSFIDQVKTTMLVTAWVFVGVEGAIVESSHAKKKEYVNQATLIGFIFTLFLYVSISVLSYGIVPQAILSKVANPSMAFVLEQVLGKTGAYIINIGLIISLLGAWLNWTILTAQLPFDAAKGGVMPALLGKKNKNASPRNSMIFTSFCTQLLIIMVFFSQDNYLKLIQLAASCILLPYLFCALFGIKSMVCKLDKNHQYRFLPILVACIAAIYILWMFYASGWLILFKSILLYVIGIPFYWYARKEKKLTLFDHFYEKIAMGILLLLTLLELLMIL